MPKISPAKQKANNAWNQRNYETISTRSRRAERLGDLIRIAAARQHTSAAAYIMQAIRQQLSADGITADDLPAAAASTNTDE